MVAPVQFPVPAPHTGSFTNGELAIGPSSGTVAGLTTYYLARWMKLRSGTYTLKCVADDSALWRINAGATILAFSNIGDGVRSLEIFIPEDMERFDITLQNMSVPASQCYVAFSLWSNGGLVYASKAEDWQIASTPISDADLGTPPDVRFSLPVWSVLPNWQNGVTERLEWLTDVLTSETAVEQRRSLRPEPRRTIEASFLRKDMGRQRLDSFFAAIGQDQFVVPVFFEQARILYDIPAGSMAVALPAGTLDQRDFADDDVCMLTLGVPGDYELVQIDTVNNGTGALTLKSATTRDWPKGTRIIPTRVARFMDAPQFSTRTDTTGVATVRFSMDMPDQVIPPDWVTPDHVWPFKIDYSQNVDSNYSRLTVVLDNQVAAPMVFDYGRRARVGIKIGCMFFGRGNVKKLRQFLGMVRGRAQRFWMQTFASDIIPSEPLVGSIITARPSGFPEVFVSPQEARTWIAVFFRDNTPTIYRRLTGVAAGVGADVYGIDEPWPAIDMAKVLRISFMVPSRFDQDGFEMLHRTDDAAAVAVNFVTMSADSEDMPPLPEE